nr:hypothetical protein [Nakamurella aerolata]
MVVVAIYFTQNRGRRASATSVEDAKAEARRWIERLGGQVLNLHGGDNGAATQALADASERYTAAGSQIEQATTVRQAQLAQQTAYEGLYYVRAARTSLGMDPGPEVPPMPGQAQAGAVTEDRRVDVEGRQLEASPSPSQRTQHYYPGGMVAGKPVPRGWYSEPWWKPALVAGAWGVGGYLLASTLFAGMAGMGGGWNADGSYSDGYADGQAAADGSGDGGDAGGDAGADAGGADGGGDWGADGGGGWGGDGGSDWGGDFGGDGGGFDFGDF